MLKRFFDLDMETKMDAHVQKNPAIRGYEPMFETRLDPKTKGGALTERSRNISCQARKSEQFQAKLIARSQRSFHDG